MYEPQHFADLQDNAAGFGAEANSWLAGAGDDHSSPLLRRTQSSFSNAPAANGTASGNLDRNLFNDLVEIVPLVQSLIDRKAKTSFTRRGSMIYTKTPARESLSKKTSEVKGRHAAQSIPTKKRREPEEKDQSKHADDSHNGDANFSFYPSGFSPDDKEEMLALKDQVEDLRRKLSEKDEIIKSAEILKSEMNSTLVELNELKHQVFEKDSIVKSTQLQLSDAKVKLADKQAAVERLQWEAMTSNTQVEKLQEYVNTMQAEMSSYRILCEGLRKSNADVSSEDYDVTLYHSDPMTDIDSLDEMEMQKIEEAKEAYIAAVAALKENQDDESIAVARSARFYLHSLVFNK